MSIDLHEKPIARNATEQGLCVSNRILKSPPQFVSFLKKRDNWATEVRGKAWKCRTDRRRKPRMNANAHEKMPEKRRQVSHGRTRKDAEKSNAPIFCYEAERSRVLIYCV